MDASLTLHAIDKSISIWEKKRDAKHPDDVRLGYTECPLCLLFHPEMRPDDEEGPNCNGCPIRKTTGYPYCIDTPYDDAEKAHDKWDDEPDCEIRHREWENAAQKEIDYLKDVRKSFLDETISGDSLKS